VAVGRKGSRFKVQKGVFSRQWQWAERVQGSRFKREYSVSSGSGQKGIRFCDFVHLGSAYCNCDFGLEDEHKSIDSLPFKKYL